MEQRSNSPSPRRRRRLPRLRYLVLGLLALLVLVQLVPYGHDYSNPPVNATPDWPNSKVEQLATDSCADCHSNTTKWPLYARIAPASWLIARDVEEGRSRLNWSEPCGEADDVREIISEGEMPPSQYTLIHRNAKLSDADAKVLADGLATALGNMNMRECPGGGD